MWDQHNTRKPILSFRLSGWLSLRADERALTALLFQDPPRTARATSQGTPRIANLLLRRVRDFAQIKGNGIINMDISLHGLAALNVDKNGLDEMDLKILETIIEKFKGGPVGITTIATAVGEDPGTIEEVYEPFLIQEGYLMRTPRGREATENAYKHLGKFKSRDTGNLFD